MGKQKKKKKITSNSEIKNNLKENVNDNEKVLENKNDITMQDELDKEIELINEDFENVNEIEENQDEDLEFDESKIKENIETYTVPKLEIPDTKKVNDKSKKLNETETALLLDKFISIDEKDFDLKNRKKKKSKINDKKNFKPSNDTAKVEGKEEKAKVKKNKKTRKKLNVKNLFKLIFRIVLLILIILFMCKAVKYAINMQGIKKADVIDKDLVVSDYTLAPLTNYGIYKTIPNVKGVYLSEYTMSSSSNVEKWINICKEKEINALVINVKNDDGRISFNIDNQVANEIGADANRTIKDPAELVLKLKQAGIFPIARIVAFKDPYLAKNRPDLAIKDASGNVLRIKSGNNWEAWVNPYNKELWEYIVDISKCAADVGFKEIQYDYIRFATGPQISEANFGFDSNEKTFRDIVLEFSRYAKDELEKYGVYVSADVFGTIITSDYDAKIVGQNYLEMGKIYDFLCPMIYPSHYNNGSLGVKYPDLDPYNLVLNAMKASNEVLDAIPKGEHRAIVRAWLQDFTAPWVTPHQTYGAKQLVEQKQAVYDSQNAEWLLWNAGNKYSLDGLLAN